MQSRNSNRIIIVFSVLLLLAAVAIVSQRKVKAAPPSGSSVTGTIKLEGTPPHQRSIDMSKEPACAAVHKASPVTAETVVAGADGGLKNVVIYISDGLTGSAATEVSPETPTWDQKGCQYIPHVMALNPNEHFKVTNSDPTSHNIHPMPTPGGPNHEWNKSQPAGAPPIDATWQSPEVAIHVKCNIHPWMSGYMVVVKGPHGISDESGSFKIDRKSTRLNSSHGYISYAAF